MTDAEPAAETDAVPPVRRSSGVVAACVAVAVIAGAMVAGLRAEGRRWADADGHAWLFTVAADGPSTSQRLADPYTLTHLLHGVAFFWVAVAAARLVGKQPAGAAWPWGWPAAAALEAGWELLENSPVVIERYRATTAALGYSGDSILNSCGDLAACLLGFLLARAVGWRASLFIAAAAELALLLAIRDGLILSTVMLLFAPDGLREWQLGR